MSCSEASSSGHAAVPALAAFVLECDACDVRQKPLPSPSAPRSRRRRSSAFSSRRRGGAVRVNDHFDGERFHNRERGWQTEGSFLKWQATREPGEWPEHPEATYGPTPPERVDGGRLRITFINHSTTLIQMDGVNILTDPVWSERVSPVSFVGPRRHRPPGIRFDDLPPIDLILVSHNHYDHMDVATLRRLHERNAAPIVTPLGNAALLAASMAFMARSISIGGRRRNTRTGSRPPSFRRGIFRRARSATAIAICGAGSSSAASRGTSTSRAIRDGAITSPRSGAASRRSARRCCRSGRTCRAGSCSRRTSIRPRPSMRTSPSARARAWPSTSARSRSETMASTIRCATCNAALAENGNPPFLVLDQGEGRDLP